MNFTRRTLDFLFPPDSGRWLAILRIGLGVELVLYLVPLRHEWNSLFGTQAYGLFGRQVGEAMTVVQSPLIPRLGWLVWLFSHLGVSESWILYLVWWGLFAAACFLIIGLGSRTAAVLAWFLQLSAAKSGGLLSYGADNFITIGLFYLMIASLPDRWSLDSRWRDLSRKELYSLGIHRRVLQIHLCFIYFFGGLTKCLGSGWWDGSNLWRALTTPPFNVIRADWIGGLSFFLPALGIVVCLLEITYPFLIWSRYSRRIVLTGVCVMHLAVGAFLGMYLFAGALLVLNLAAFWPNEQRTNEQRIGPDIVAA